MIWLQNPQSKLYVAEIDGEWTHDLEQARSFPTPLNVYNFAILHDIIDQVRIVFPEQVMGNPQAA
jgi:hypothetical protein